MSENPEQDKKDAQNCWEFWDCPEETRNNCAAYTRGLGKECYCIAYNFCPRIKRDFASCLACPWYHKLIAPPDK